LRRSAVAKTYVADTIGVEVTGLDVPYRLRPDHDFEPLSVINYVLHTVWTVWPHAVWRYNGRVHRRRETPSLRRWREMGNVYVNCGEDYYVARTNGDALALDRDGFTPKTWSWMLRVVHRSRNWGRSRDRRVDGFTLSIPGFPHPDHVRLLAAFERDFDPWRPPGPGE
jgi:hypothetical protein